MIRQKFQVIKRIEVPRSEYSYDAAVNLIVELNDQYNPAFIYCDAGAGEYQIERLHMIGDQRPATGLKNKVKRWQFKQSIEVTDPITFEVVKHPLKQFMITQLQIAFEREMMMLSMFDEVLHKQLIDYCVEKQTANGPVFTSENEHFIDALGLAYLAMVLEFKELTNMMKEPETSTKVEFSRKTIGSKGINEIFREVESTGGNPYIPTNIDKSDRPGDRPTQFKVPLGYKKQSFSTGSWGSRSSGLRRGSSSFERKTW